MKTVPLNILIDNAIAIYYITENFKKLLKSVKTSKARVPRIRRRRLT